MGLATFAALKKGNVTARYLKSSKESDSSVLFRAAKFGVKTSMTSASLTSYCLTNEDDKRELTNRIAHALLMPTQSTSADLFCNSVLGAFERNENELTKLYPKLDAESMEKFAQNCQLRREYERKLREEQDLGDQEPVSIPSMGVATEVPLDESVMAMKAKYLQYYHMLPHIEEEILPDHDDELHLLCSEIRNKDMIELLIVVTVTFLFLRKAPRRLFDRIRPYIAGFSKQVYLLDPSQKVDVLSSSELSS